MQQRLSKLEAAQRLGVSPSTLDRMIRRGELEIEREGRGDRAKVWVLAPGLSSDAPGGQPVDAGPSPEAELAAAREQVRVLQELADYRGKLLDEAEWRYRELLQELRKSQTMLEGLTRALPPGGTEESPRGWRWWPFGPGQTGFWHCPHRRGRRQGVPLAQHPAAFYTQGHAVLGLRSRGAPARAGDPQVRWLLPVQVPGRHRLPVKLFVHAAP